MIAFPGQTADTLPVEGDWRDTDGKIAVQRARYVRRLGEAVEEIRRRLGALAEVRELILFGSFARGQADLFTDLDVLVVMETDEPVLDRLRRLYSLLALPVDLDLLCYTPAEFARARERPFLRHALRGAVVLHAQPAA